jgi:uncharacterized protein
LTAVTNVVNFFSNLCVQFNNKHKQQRLTNVNHPDHTLITYPNLGHVFYPSSQWSRGAGVGIEQYVLADIYGWLEAHSGLSHSVATTTAYPIGASTSSLNTSTTSPSKR